MNKHESLAERELDKEPLTAGEKHYAPGLPDFEDLGIPDGALEEGVRIVEEIAGDYFGLSVDGSDE